MLSRHFKSEYVGRFAPSPTGDLHFGSLVAAVGSYVQALARGGSWLIRIEDIDPPREVPGSAERIICELAKLGMESDQAVLYQSTRQGAYTEAIERLLREGKAFRCSCSRKDLTGFSVYPGTCRDKALESNGTSVRLKVGNSTVGFTDAVMGEFVQNLAEEAGDFIIQRSDGLPAYQLAVVLDDAHQGVTEVVRGADLLDSTPRQILLQKALGLPTPDYMHLPVVMQANGQKLSKRLGSDPVNTVNPENALANALNFLGQEPPSSMELGPLWLWAIDNWRVERIPRSVAPEVDGVSA